MELIEATTKIFCALIVSNKIDISTMSKDSLEVSIDRCVYAAQMIGVQVSNATPLEEN